MVSADNVVWGAYDFRKVTANDVGDDGFTGVFSTGEDWTSWVE
jgi:hypothetical protein